MSLLMSAFALPAPPGGLAALPSSACGTLRYRGRRTEDGRRNTDSLTTRLPKLAAVLRLSDIRLANFARFFHRSNPDRSRNPPQPPFHPLTPSLPTHRPAFPLL